jgi:hypothetical protein
VNESEQQNAEDMADGSHQDKSCPVPGQIVSASVLALTTDDPAVLALVAAALSNDKALLKFQASLQQQQEQWQRDVDRLKARRLEADADRRAALSAQSEAKAGARKAKNLMDDLQDQIQSKPRAITALEKAIKQRTHFVDQQTRSHIWRYGKRQLAKDLKLK